jgi:hypothetical protein
MQTEDKPPLFFLQRWKFRARGNGAPEGGKCAAIFRPFFGYRFLYGNSLVTKNLNSLFIFLRKSRKCFILKALKVVGPVGFEPTTKGL